MNAVGYCIALGVLLGSPGGVSGQAALRRLVIDSDVDCQRCQITIHRIARLGGPEGLAGTGRIVKRDSRGRYYVVDIMTADQEIFVFSPGGTYLRTIGRKGSGPGEYRGISRLVVLPSDSLRVEDVRNSRYTILSPEYELVRTVRFRTDFMPRVRYPNGRWITSNIIRTPDRVGYPLHWVDTDGTILRSFGTDQPIYRPGMLWELVRALAPTGDGNFLAARRHEYVIEKWDTLGTKLLEIVRDAPWFSPWVDEPHISPDAPPRKPKLMAIHEDAHGYIWAFIEVPQRDWKNHLYRDKGRDGEPAGAWLIGGITQNSGFDTIIEVIDPDKGRLLASRRVPAVFWKFVGGDLAYADGEDDEQLRSFVDIWRFRLVQSHTGHGQ